MSRDAGDGLGLLRRAVGDRFHPFVQPVRSFVREDMIDESFFGDHVAQAVQQGDVGPRLELQMQIGQPRQLGPARIDYDQRHPAPMRLLDARTDDRMGFGRIGPDDHDQPGMVEIFDRIGRRRRPQRLHHAGDGRAVADAGAVIDVIGADDTAHELAEEIIFFVRAAAGGNRRQRIRTMFRLDAGEFLRDAV